MNIYRQRANLVTNVQPDGWANVRLPDASAGIALDPVLFAIWSAAEGHTVAEVAHIAQVSTYLASCVLAVLQRAGLLLDQSPPASPLLDDLVSTTIKVPVSVVIIHNHAQADLDDCVASVLSQGYPALAEITVVTATSVTLPAEEAHLVQCEDASLVHTLVEQLSQATGDAVLLLDSRSSLAPGSLAEMVRTLELRDDIAAVAPRLMWKQWPGFVAQIGDWRSGADVQRNPYAGLVDVGQFERWQETPAIDLSAGLVSHAALEQVGLPDSKYSLDWVGADWCHRARLRGYHILAALRAVAYGPWPAAIDLGQEAQDNERLNDLAPPGPGPMLHEGIPALTVDNVRAVYSQYPAIATLPIRRRIVFVGQETARHRAMAQQLSTTCEVSWVAPRDDDDPTALRPLCDAADLVIATAESLQRLDFLQRWRRPIVVDMQPPLMPSARIEPAHNALSYKQQHWLQTVDGVVCASEEERLYWLGQLAARDRFNPRVWRAASTLGDLVMVVPTGVEVNRPPSHPVLKGVHPGIGADDTVILWCGGLRSRDDPLTAIRAFAELQSAHSGLALVFVTFDDQEQDTECLQLAVRLVTTLNLTHTVFIKQHVPAHLRSIYLAKADLGLALGTDTLEARLHEPVNLPACVGAGLPLVVTAGCAGSSLVQRYGLGQTVPACDVKALSQTCAECVQIPRAAYSDRFTAAGAALAWSQTIAPLAYFCQQPHYAPDRQITALLRPESALRPPPPTPLWALPTKIWQTLGQRGLRGTAREVRQYIRWKTGI